MKIPTILVVIALSLPYVAKSKSATSCDSYQNEFNCVDSSDGACKWLNEKCRCGSDVKLDIMFGVDTSGSITWDGFQIEKEFISMLVSQGINNGSRIGFTMFNTDVNMSRGIQEWDTLYLQDYVEHIYWTAGFTNTPGLLQTVLPEFAATKDDSRQQVLLLITDGRPCLPESRGGCPQSVCNYAARVKSAGIRVVVIGVGPKFKKDAKFVPCLLQSDDDLIYVSSFSKADFKSIMGSLSNIFCPISKELKVTEVKSQRKKSGWNRRWGRFVEIYNMGIDFNLNELTFTGLITGSGPNVNVSQGQYIVFYDAADDNTGSSPTTPSIPTCHLCGTPCDLSQCGDTSDTATGYCWCGNAVYVACKNTAENCGTIPDFPYATAENGCTGCSFNDNDTAYDWDIRIVESIDNTILIDEVVYDSNTWIAVDDGFSYELRSKGFDNDVGDNWAQSCSVFGTPGSDPLATCSETCINKDCGGGQQCNINTGFCDCDATTGYYPQCMYNTNGIATSCTKCLLVPGIDKCQVLWNKNGTDRFAKFNWTAIDRDQDTFYELSFFDGGNTDGAITSLGPANNNPIYEPYKTISNYYPGNKSYGGYVRSVIESCRGAPAICTYYYSPKVWCEVITQSPTTSPTPAPTPSPTNNPTPQPTASPIWPCPNYWWINEDICNPDRCDCNDKNKKCCLLEPIFKDGVIQKDRKHKSIYDCKLDIELNKPSKRADGLEKAGESPGYLITISNSPTKHYFNIDISPQNYPYTMDIFWRLNFNKTDPIRAGLKVYPQTGWLTVYGTSPAELAVNATVVFTSERVGCEGSSNVTQQQNCVLATAIYGELIIVNATSREQPLCYDGRIYPMRIPVWYNNNIIDQLPFGNEKELPAWLWWLIAALTVFIALLIFLLYKYWWNTKITGAAVISTQAKLDEAIEDEEMGFGHDLGDNKPMFNTLAIGYNPYTPTDQINPNAPPNGDGCGAEFIIPNNHKQIYRQQYGPKAPISH